ncbi:MAG TPA: helix-turn-helix domain-containing protein [Candidatus Melainabacteria bacterium]|nr:helix-turn-helix domain-containing protein [Candidatus Melainabacteria bacterium]
MGQPDIQQTFNAVSVEGFDQIYQPQPSKVQSAPDVAQVDPTMEAQRGPALEVQPDPADGISLEEAARLLGLHMDTVRKRLQKGKIKGFKVADKFGEKWLVHKDELASAKVIQQPIMPEAQAVPETIHAYSVDQIQADPTESTDDPVVEIELGPEQAQRDPTQNTRDDHEYQRLITIIESQAHQLKAAGDVIVFLRSELEDKNGQLKLLTDQSAKRTGFWSRVRDWVTGKRLPSD